MHRWVLTRTGGTLLVVALLQGHEALSDSRRAGEDAYRFAYPMLVRVPDISEDRFAQAEPPLHVMSKQCNEDAIRVRVDQRLFQGMVGSRFSPVLDGGKATILILAQDCSQCWIDGENLGPTQDVHVWLAVEGAKDNRPVVGALFTRPTMTWLRLFDGSTNSRLRDVRTAAGTVQAAIEGLHLDPPAPSRGGRVSFSRNLVYSWQLASAAPAAPMAGVNHDVYTKTANGGIVLDRIQALVHVSAAASQGTLKVVGGAELLPWIAAGSYAVSVSTFFPMWARGSFGVSETR